MTTYRKGWFGNSHGHSLAARGIKIYAAKKTSLVDPLFYAKKHEAQVKFNDLLDDIREGKTYHELLKKYPDADKEVLRKRGIKAIETREGRDTLSMVDANGVDASVHMARNNPRTKERMHDVLHDYQKSSFLPTIKVELLKERLR
jgi:hypothetical protein